MSCEVPALLQDRARRIRRRRCVHGRPHGPGLRARQGVRGHGPCGHRGAPRRTVPRAARRRRAHHGDTGPRQAHPGHAAAGAVRALSPAPRPDQRLGPRRPRRLGRGRSMARRQARATCSTSSHLSSNLWERRTAILATMAFIRERRGSTTRSGSRRLLLKDDQDLIHKAVGWALRAAGDSDRARLRTFLDRHANDDASDGASVCPRALRRSRASPLHEPEEGGDTVTEREPVETTNLDRYGNEALPWSRARDVLEALEPSAHVTWFLGTARRDGRPHAAGVGAMWHDGDLYFTSGDGTRKSRDLAGNPVGDHLRQPDRHRPRLRRRRRPA